MKKLLFIFFFCCVHFIVAQHPISIQLTQKDGLPDIEFYDMIEDDKGFIWLACNKGLYRYDGREFKNYTHSEKRGLSVFNLAFDKQNRLWCTNVTGQFFYVENDKLQLFFDASKELNEEQLFSFSFYDNDIILFRKNLCLKVNLITKKQTVLDKKNTKDSNFFYTFSAIKNDTLFLLKYEDKTSINYLLKESATLKNYNEIFNRSHATLYVNSRNQLIYQELISNKKLQRKDVSKNSVKEMEDLPLDNFKINNIYQSDNEEWFLTEKGANVFSLKDNFGALYHYFPTKNITEVVKDRQDNYWFSTLRNGVFIVPNIHINAYDLKQNIGNITAIENVNNTDIYFGTTLGWLGIYNLKKKTTKYFQLNTSGSKVRHILFNKKLKDVYIATNLYDGNYLVDASSKQVKKMTSRGIFGSAKSMVFLNDGRLFSSLVSNHAFTTLVKGKVVKKENKSLRGKRVYNTFFDAKKEQIYVANVDELVVYDLDFNPTFIRYKNKPIFARGITQTNDGIIWVSTFKDGVLAIKNNEVVQTYSTENGLLSNQTSYIKADGNNVWITTDKGLQYLNPQNNTFKNLTQKDGIESFNIVGMEIIGNKVWYGSNLGLFSFDKSKVFKPETVVNPYITSVTIADSTYVVKPKYEVAADEKRIAIKFNTNQFQSAENTNYQYKLSGVQNNWQNVSKGVNEVVFNSLEEGNYTFQLRTVNGKKTSEIREIQFKVNEVFYKRWWFVLLTSLIIISLVIYYYSNLLKRQEKKRIQDSEKQQNEFEKITLKLENLRSQMNPHFVFNALNSIQDYILNNQKELAGDYLGKFADLIRMYLDQSSKKEILLAEEIETLERYLELEKLRFENKLNYKIEISKDIDIDEIVIPTMLIQPYVENALKHGLLHKKTVGHLIVKFSVNPEKTYLNVRIIDDGVGRKRSAEIKEKQFRKHQSFATEATQNRLELLNFNRKNKISISVEDVNTEAKTGNVGTKVTLRIPIS